MNPQNTFQTEEIVHGTPDQEIHLLDVLIILSRKRRFILVATVCTAILVAIIVLVLPSSYTATTVVLPPGQNSSSSTAILAQLMGGASGLSQAAGASLGIRSPGEMYLSLFKSRTVEDGMIQRFNLLSRYHQKKVSDARKALETHCKVTLGSKDGLITVEVTDKDPKFAADMANGYVDEFKKLSATLAVTEASQRRAFFQQQLVEANENLVRAESTMEHTQQSTGILQVDSQARSLIETAAALRGQVAAKKVELQGMLSYATESNPQIVLVEHELDELKAQLAQLGGTTKDPGSDVLVSKGDLPKGGMEYFRSLRDVKYYEAVKDIIAKEFEMAKLDEAREGAIVQVADVAVPPDKRSFPKRTITVILAVIIGFFGACGWAIFSEAFARIQNDSATKVRLDALRDTFRKPHSITGNTNESGAASRP